MPHSDPVLLRELLGPDATPCRRALTGETGVALPALTDHHVHLHLIDEHRLAAGGIAAVLDLGGDPAALARRARESMPRVAYAGAFLTAPGGYPSGRPWAPAAAVRIVSDPSPHPGVAGGAATAVDEQATCGASVIKVALDASAGPVLPPDVLAAIVSCARERGLPVVAHAAGEGMTRLAVEAGVDALAHAPFAEVVPADLIAQAVARGQRWISTLDIHRDHPRTRDRAGGNLAAFAGAGGRVLYGTDLGNGDLPVGVNARELAALHAADVRGPALVHALNDPWPAPTTHAVSTFVPGAPPAAIGEVPAWLAGAVVVPAEELIHDEP